MHRAVFRWLACVCGQHRQCRRRRCAAVRLCHGHGCAVLGARCVCDVVAQKWPLDGLGKIDWRLDAARRCAVLPQTPDSIYENVRCAKAMVCWHGSRNGVGWHRTWFDPPVISWQHRRETAQRPGNLTGAWRCVRCMGLVLDAQTSLAVGCWR